MNLEGIRALCEAATPGPWWYRYDGSSTWIVDPKDDPEAPHVASLCRPQSRLGDDCADAAFIAAARTLLPKLLEVAEAADRLTDNICEFSTITDSIFVENLDDALFALEADS